MALHRRVRREWTNLAGWHALIAFVVVFAAAVYPVFARDFVSINDIYNHIARVAVLARYKDDPTFMALWVPNWRFVPYLGFDLAALGLLSFFGMDLVVRLMVAGSLLSLFGGAVLLSRTAHQRWSAVVLLCALFLMSRTLLSGLVNYLFGLGVAFLGTTAWIRLRERPTVTRVSVLTAFAVATCAIHLFSCGVLGVVVFGVEVAILRQRGEGLYRSLLALGGVCAAFLPALLLVIFVAPHPDYPTFIVYRDVISRLSAFAVPLTYAPWAEAVGFLAIGLAIAACWATGRLAVDRRLATAAALLCLFQLAMPNAIGAATGADHRIPIAFWIVLVCAIDIRIQRTSAATAFLLLASSVMAARVGLVDAQWKRDDVFYDEARGQLALLPDHARVGSAFRGEALGPAAGPAIALYYLPAWVLVPRGGFTQTLFTKSDQHSLLMQPPTHRLADSATPGALWGWFVEGAPMPPAALAAVAGYDYLVFLDSQPFAVRLSSILETVSEGPGIRIYRVRHHDGGSGNSGTESSTQLPSSNPGRAGYRQVD
jgi:hypothetical protein